MKKVFVKRTHPGHPWVFSNEIVDTEASIPGEVVDIYKEDLFVGRGFYNPHSLIAVRMYTHTHDEFDTTFVRRLMEKALAYRTSLSTDTSYRLIYSESDGLPGLIIDRYDNTFVMQVHSYGLEQNKRLIVDALMAFSPCCVYEKSEPALRKLEGLPVANGVLYGTEPELIEIKQDSVRFLVDIIHGQKTGFFFDLKDARRAVQGFAHDKSVLDLFCYTGGFSLYAAMAGARSVVGIDSSRSAIELARHNAQRNRITNTRFECYDVFDFLRTNKERFDIIILDPPSFTKSKKEVMDARRGYKDINLRAMKALTEQGIIVTTCCSFHFSDDDFLRVINSAALHARRSFRIRERCMQSADHPIMLALPESNYLKCYVLEHCITA